MSPLYSFIFYFFCTVKHQSYGISMHKFYPPISRWLKFSVCQQKINLPCCKGGGSMPVFVSLPHFHGADPAYLEQFAAGSLAPNVDRHSTHMVLQKETSIPLEVAMRLQIILQVKS
jgi:CD36 family